MSKESEAFWNQTGAYIDMDAVETATCVRMFKVVGNELKYQWVPLKEVADMKDDGWDCMFYSNH